MARPKLDAAVVIVRLSLSLREGEDDDLIAFFASLPERHRARAVTTALRQGGVTAVHDAAESVEEIDLGGLLF